MKIELENMFTLLSIEAWADKEQGWQWNNWFRIEENIFIENETSNRKLLSFFRQNGWLGNNSKGKVTVENDGYNIVILDRKTREPLYALEPQWQI
jgi:hypothetical protein